MATVQFGNVSADMRLTENGYGIAALQGFDAFIGAFIPVHQEIVIQTESTLVVRQYDASGSYITITALGNLPLGYINSFTVEAAGVKTTALGNFTITQAGDVFGTATELQANFAQDNSLIVNFAGLSAQFDNGLLASPTDDIVLSGADTITAGNGNDYLLGYAGDDSVSGGAGHDTLDGGLGADSMAGGAGNDVYYVDDANDSVTENAGEGTDDVRASVSFTLQANIENMTLTGSWDINGIGNALNNIITGNTGNNVLDGRAGADSMAGGAGNDTYVVDNAGDVVTENLGEGADRVQSVVSFALPINAEDLVLLGTGDINGSGNDLGNVINGNAGNNLIDGGTGADSMYGGAGDDVLDGGAGTDLMQGGTGDDIYFVDSAVAIPGTYLSISNWGGGSGYFFTPATGSFTLNASDDGLDGDTLVDTVTLYYSEPAGGGHFFSVDISTRMLGMPLAPGTYTDAMRYPFESSGHPGLWVAGDGSGANTSTGSFTVTAGDFTYGGSTPQISQFVVNFTYSGDGGPTVTGTLSVNGPGGVQTDTVVELPNEGTDTVRSLITGVLPVNVEILELIGSNSINGTGNELNNRLVGNDAGNTLTGLAGNDTLDGGTGMDTAVYSGLRSQYQITLQADGSLTVADQRSNAPDGEDTVSHVELFQFTDGTYTAESVPDKTANLLVYDWKSHTLLDGVSIVDGSHNGTTDASGSTSFTGITSTSLALTASRSIPGAEATLTSQAVNLQDATAILKMIVGLEVNGAGRALSPYQSLAADYNGNGTVGLTDAIDVLKHVVGLPAPDPAWRFVNEIDATIPGKVGLTPGTLPATIGADMSGTATQVHVGLVGILNGDVDGSFAGAPESQDLDVQQPTYFVDLTSAHGLQLSQFGVYT